jgi:hypothetical protein
MALSKTAGFTLRINACEIAFGTIKTEAEFNSSHNFLQYLDAFRARPHGQKFLHPGIENDQPFEAEKSSDPANDAYK